MATGGILLSREQVFKKLIDAGASPQTAVVMTAVAQLESGFWTGAKNPNSTATGLFQFLRVHWQDGSWDPRDPDQSVEKALWLLGRQGINAWEAVTLAEDNTGTWRTKLDQALSAAYMTATDLGYSVDKPTTDDMKAYTAGTNYSTGVTRQTTGATSETQTSAPATGDGSTVPSGYELYSVDGAGYLAYEIGQGDATATLFYRVDGELPPGQVTRLTGADWAERTATNMWIDAGSTGAFEGLDPGISYQEMYEQVLWEMGLYGTDALADASVMRVIGEMLARPDMEAEEFANRLRRTEWFSAHTEKQRAWNDKSEAQQELEILETAGTLAGLYFTYLGVDMDAAFGSVTQLQRGNSKLYEWAFNVASGAATQSQAVNSWLKPEARKNPESPWSRTVRKEVQEQGQYEVDIESSAAEVMNMYFQYGLPMTYTDAKAIGEQLVMNQISMADVQEQVKDQAVALYPTKPRDVATRTWAQPYMQTMQTLWEIPEPDLQDSTLQSALSQGATLGDFRKTLKQDDRWLSTKNASDEMHATVSRLGQMMGF